MKSILKEEKNYRISGRSTWVEDTLYLGFSGSFIEFRTDSKAICINIVTDKVLEEENLRARVAIFTNNCDLPVVDTILNQSENVINLSLDGNANIVRIEKLSEAAFGLVGIKSIDVDDEAAVESTDAKLRKIEFVGDSITCGYGVEASCELDIFKTSQQNPEKAYAIKTAKALSAEYQLVSWSGIGTLSDWVEETVNEPREEILMKDLYPYRDLRLSEKLNITAEPWDFENYKPDLVVVNLGTNDDSFVRQIPEREEIFKKTYIDMLNIIYEKNNGCPILGVLGVMGRNLCHVEEQAVSEFIKIHPEAKIDYLDLPDQNSEIDGIGADYHPSAKTQQKVADLVVEKIRKFMNWEG